MQTRATPLGAPGGVVVCVDVGSTFTKAAAVGPDGQLLACAQHPTTIGTDVLDGADAAVAALRIGPIPDHRILACSSAGGGLRLAVVGQERVVSAEAGRRVALSAGARVVAVSAGPLDAARVAALAAAKPDILLLVGGTDGGDPEILVHNAEQLGRCGIRAPVVVAGNAEAAGEAARLAGRRRRVVITVDNVIPRIGYLVPGPARRAIRDVFISHVIGGKGLSAGRRFARLVTSATPDAVLAGVELVAGVDSGDSGSGESAGVAPGGRSSAQGDGTASGRVHRVGDVLVVDVGGATTDVYSVLEPDNAAHESVVETLWHGRTVEGDLGVRWSATDVVAAAEAERIAIPGGLREEARMRHHDVWMLPSSAEQAVADVDLARLAAVIAVRRHARPGPEGVRDLSRVALIIGSGGVLRHAEPSAAAGILGAVLGDYAGGWRVPGRARELVDRDYLLAPIGLLALAGHSRAARGLADRLLMPQRPAGPCV